MLIDQLLQLARADAYQERLSREPVELTALAQHVLDNLLQMAIDGGVDVRLHAQQLVWVLGDQVRLSQVVLNLADNALRHVNTGGQVEVFIGATDGTAEIVVADTGSGIAPEHLTRLFDRFYRVDPSRDRDRGGAGLGLAG